MTTIEAPPPPSVVVIHVAVTGAIGLLAAVVAGSSAAGLIMPLCVGIVLLFAWMLWSWWYTTHSSFDPYLMFICSLFAFNAGQTPLEVLHLNERGLLDGRFDDETMIATLLIVALAMSVTHLGALLAAHPSALPGRPLQLAPSSQSLRRVGWTLLIVSAMPSVFLIRDSWNTATQGGYLSLYEREASVGAAASPHVLATFLIPAAMFLLAGSAGRGRERVTAVTVICLYTLTQLVLGYRSAAFPPICAAVWLWDRVEWRVSRRWIVGGTVVVLAVFAVIRETRELNGAERWDPKSFIDSYRSMEKPAALAMGEMGASMGVIAHTYVLVPSSRPFDLGVSYGYAMSTIMPNLFWSIHPAIAHGAASEWLVWAVDPLGASRRAGLGFSCIAEAYLNFGWIGVVVVMGLIGFGVGILTVSGRHGSRGWLAFIAVVTVFLLRFPRDESASIVRAVVWYSLLPYGTATFLTRLGTLRYDAGASSPPEAVAAQAGLEGPLGGC